MGALTGTLNRRHYFVAVSAFVSIALVVLLLQRKEKGGSSVEHLSNLGRLEAVPVAPIRPSFEVTAGSQSGRVGGVVPDEREVETFDDLEKLNVEEDLILSILDSETLSLKERRALLLKKALDPELFLEARALALDGIFAELDDSEFSDLEELFLDPKQSEEILDAINHEIYGRDQEVIVGALAKVMDVPGHPLSSEARETVMFLTDSEDGLTGAEMVANFEQLERDYAEMVTEPQVELTDFPERALPQNYVEIPFLPN